MWMRFERVCVYAYVRVCFYVARENSKRTLKVSCAHGFLTFSFLFFTLLSVYCVLYVTSRGLCVCVLAWCGAAFQAGTDGHAFIAPRVIKMRSLCLKMMALLRVPQQPNTYRRGTSRARTRLHSLSLRMYQHCAKNN